MQGRQQHLKWLNILINQTDTEEVFVIQELCQNPYQMLYCKKRGTTTGKRGQEELTRDSWWYK
jgi:hypothetical protein